MDDDEQQAEDFAAWEEVDADEAGLGSGPPEVTGVTSGDGRAPPPWAELSRLLALNRKDLREAAKTLGAGESRFLVDQYYALQQYRISAANQVRALGVAREPNDAVRWVQAQFLRVEEDIKAALDVYTMWEPTGMGRWVRRVVGVGPVIAAGLVCHLDIQQARTVGHWWRFAGLDPTNEWLGTERARRLVDEAYLATGEEGPPGPTVYAWLAQQTHRSLAAIERLSRDKQGTPSRTALASGLARRPWNASLKVLLWKAGESFVKTMNHPEGFYGRVFAERKQAEQAHNEAGHYADQARAKLERYKIGRDTDAWLWYSGSLTPEDGRRVVAAPAGERAALARKLAVAPGTGVPMLPPGHVHARAKRYAVKHFLAAYHEEAYRRRYGVLPPVPFAIAHLGHAHKMASPVPFTPVPGEADRAPIPKGAERPGKRA